MDRDERRARLEAIREHVREHDVGRLDRTQLLAALDESLRRRAVRIGDRMSELSPRRRVGRVCAWWTSAASRSRGAARSRARPCAWRRRPHGACASCRRATRSRRRQLAGIMAAKRTSELIPLCHPLPLTHVEVRSRSARRASRSRRVAETTAQTGVEMEALDAASVAALTVYDMAKAIDKGMSSTEVGSSRRRRSPCEGGGR